MKIAAGTGYVGPFVAVLLSQQHEATTVDIIPEKVDLINQRKSPAQDEHIEKISYLGGIEPTAPPEWRSGL